jgi:cyclic beta-1,2-glucan synthetase
LNYFGPPRLGRATLGFDAEIEAPISAELYSVERLEHYAEALATSQEIAPKKSAGVSLHSRLRDNATVLQSAYKSLVSDLRTDQAVTPAADWLVDNYYIVDEHVRAIRRDLPPQYYRQLPKLARGGLRGYPRVYGIVWALIAHTDSRFELDTLVRFIGAYQRQQPLTLGELWAIAITLRVILIENLRRLAAGIVARRRLRGQADALADRLLGENAAGAVADTSELSAYDALRLPDAFAAQLFQRLRDHDPDTTAALPWLHAHLGDFGTSADEVMHAEHQRQGAANVSVRNVITSLRLISSVDWAKFVERVSLVDALLRAESAFALLDFPTRDLYRHAIEDLARGSGRTELDVARQTIDLSRQTGQEPGHFLLARGRASLERELGYRAPWNRKPERWTRRAGLPGYAGTIALIAFALAAVPLLTLGAGLERGLRLCVALVGVLLASDLAVAIVQLWVTRCVAPSVLPALELADGVPPELRTLVAVPTLLAGTADIIEQVHALEVHYLASQDGDLRFALLSDWADADAETLPDDAVSLATAAGEIARLNRIHGPIDGEDRFLLLHRRRVFNERQGRWMGWERKRGKLQELGRLLQGAGETTFVAVNGRSPSVPRGVRYVICLDADTRLPHGAARKLIGKMAHPLNRPVMSEDQSRVVDGYGILQPRVTPSLPSGLEGSLFQQVFSGRSGMDPYAFAVSDVYQDLFGEGSFTGKGIYDVAAFEASMAGRVPDNQLLSHDLYEGIYARCGLASDVEFIEEFPARYDVARARQQRWARGDWQLLPWIVGLRSPVPALGRWKMLDNLRRTLMAPAAYLGLVFAWSRHAAAPWTLIVVGALVLPALLPLALGLPSSLGGFPNRGKLRAFRSDAELALLDVGLRLAFLADQAWSMGGAIARTLVRIGITHRNLLEWTTAAQARVGLTFAVGGFFRRMRGGLLLAVLAPGAALLATHHVAWIAAPFVLLWLAAPLLARHVSLPNARAAAAPLLPAERASLRRTARETWSFFETFVTARHNMLPPDNFQEIPHPVVATRTSPTNVGLYLLSVAAAREFGWIGLLDALDRLEATLATLDRLERYRGHFLNWYDTQDLRALEPKYVSTVDSGNFAGHLLALTGTCCDWALAPASGADWRAGIEDTLAETLVLARTLDDERRHYAVSRDQLIAALDAMALSLRRGATTDQETQLRGLLAQADAIRDIAQALTDDRGETSSAPLLCQARSLRANVESHLRDVTTAPGLAAEIERRLSSLAGRARSLALAMEFEFLVEPERKLLAIGYRIADRCRDQGCYDLLASEARLASYVAIAKGDLPVSHWFRLGRLLTPVERGSALVSWSGSMFEYLMPELVMREPAGSVLGATAQRIVQRQIAYGAQRCLPWGVSESAFNARDVELTYQYSSFGVPGLGLQRGLGEEAVVAPYATGLAAMVDAHAALRNFAALEDCGGRGRFGWYDALDFTPARVPEGKTVVPVKAYMAHHQGMMLVAIANVLKDGLFRTRFHSEPMIQAADSLLQERVPRDSDASPPRADEVQGDALLRELAAAVPRRFSSPHHVAPRTHLLSNGRYSVMVTVAGSGYSRWQDLAVTRWREDATRDPWGSYVFLRDVASGIVWSAGYQPIGREPDSYEVSFLEDRAEITRVDGRIVTSTEILVSPEDDAEVRRVSITNDGNQWREIEVTSYAEVVLASPAADDAHPAFSKMFIETEFVAEGGALLATRRSNEPGARQLWLAHIVSADGEALGALQFETDRARFLGRGRDLHEAVSIMDARPLSNTCGIVLDPVLALRRRVRIAPGQTTRLAFWTLLAASRVQAIALADKHRDTAAFLRVKTLCWTQAQVQLRYLGVDFDEAQQFQRIANRVLYADPALRASRELLARNEWGQSALWPYGISGDLPIVLVRIDDDHDLNIVKQLLRAHGYWESKCLAVDLVILNDRPPSYASDLQHGLDAAIRMASTRSRAGNAPGRGRVFALRADLMSVTGRELLQTAARAILIARRGSLGDQLARLREADPAPRPVSSPRAAGAGRPGGAPPLPPLEFFNGLGGFTADGREYVTILEQDQWTPAPWTNVITNARFGFQASADGTGSTWSINSRENQLTPWSNDPVGNRPGEVVYLRDEDDGELWSATPLPIREASRYVIRHGFGYTRVEHDSHDVALDLLQFVPEDDPVKISRLKITNRSGERRRLSVTYYVEWVLGNQRAKSAPFVITERDPKTSAVLARNPWNSDFSGRVAFADLGGRQQSFTCDRAQFIGRHGSLAEPAALLQPGALDNRSGGGLDPCAALQMRLELQPGETVEVVMLLGQEASRAEAIALIERCRAQDPAATLSAVTRYWERTLGALQVKTPDRSMDILLNGWLLYQCLSARVWARTGFYQASGAYGFRDQLQDVMALCIARPNLAREQVLRAAARQFEAGDVQHWWLPSTGQGVKTRISDDRIWLPYVVAHYLKISADTGVLDEPVAFLDGAPLAADQLESFGAPGVTARTAPLYEHCALALDSSLAIGSHGLPLFGTGDWNDGMNRVGVGGHGESVWLGWFLYATLLEFAPIAERRGDTARAAIWRKHAFAVQQSAEREAWDGDWYRRGYFDDGTALGSVASDECRIDSIAQSWAVISGAADPARARRAMAAVNSQLVSRSDGLVQLFTPAFDRTAHDPGYIKAYPPGLRENGGQYTHAAMWVTLAFAALGDGDMAGELFSLLNPINHGSTRASIHRYKVEPYVACADVYCAATHVGRGGWTWYTGSAAWMYRTAIEGILGIHVRGNTLCIDPCIPRGWTQFEFTYRYGAARYVVRVTNPQGVNRGVQQLFLDERAQPPLEGAGLELIDDGRSHTITVVLG